MSNQVMTDFIDELVFQLLVSQRVLSRQPNLSNCGFRAILFVKRTDGASIREVATFLNVTLPRASNVVDELVKKQLLLRQTSSDRRRAEIHLTDDGQHIANSLHAVHAEVARRMLDKMSPGERTELTHAMRHCVAALKSLS